MTDELRPETTREPAVTPDLAEIEVRVEEVRLGPHVQVAGEIEIPLRREQIEAAERPARVIAFPKFTQPLTSRSSNASRWMVSTTCAPTPARSRSSP